MYSSRSGLVLCFHGCNKAIADEALMGEVSLKASNNKYDWLGHGVYFWDNSPSRALDFATYLRDHPKKDSRQKIIKPAVVVQLLVLDFV